MITNPEFESINKIINNRFNYLNQKTNYIQYNVEWSNWTERAIDHFGTTLNPHEAGYILYDGQMLDFSGFSEDERSIDHSEIMQIFTDSELDEANKKYVYGGVISLFQNLSNSIRLVDDIYGGEDIHISIQDTQKITQSQIKTLEYIKKYSDKKERNIYYDVYDKDARAVKYGKVSSVSELINKINNYIEDSSRNKFNSLRGY